MNPANVIADVSSQSRLNMSQFDGKSGARVNLNSSENDNDVKSHNMPKTINSSGSSMNQVLNNNNKVKFDQEFKQ